MSRREEAEEGKPRRHNPCSRLSVTLSIDYPRVPEEAVENPKSWRNRPQGAAPLSAYARAERNTCSSGPRPAQHPASLPSTTIAGTLRIP